MARWGGDNCWAKKMKQMGTSKAGPGGLCPAQGCWDIPQALVFQEGAGHFPFPAPLSTCPFSGCDPGSGGLHLMPRGIQFEARCRAQGGRNAFPAGRAARGHRLHPLGHPAAGEGVSRTRFEAQEPHPAAWTLGDVAPPGFASLGSGLFGGRAAVRHPQAAGAEMEIFISGSCLAQQPQNPGCLCRNRQTTRASRPRSVPSHP